MINHPSLIGLSPIETHFPLKHQTIRYNYVCSKVSWENSEKLIEHFKIAKPERKVF